MKSFIAHTKGILVHIKEYCQEKTSLKSRLFSDKNITSLVEFILVTLSSVTKQDEYQLFIRTVWSLEEKKAKADGVDTKPEFQLAKMKEYLTEISETSETFVTLNIKKSQNEIGGLRDSHPNQREDFDR